MQVVAVTNEALTMLNCSLRPLRNNLGFKRNNVTIISMLKNPTKKVKTKSMLNSVINIWDLFNTTVDVGQKEIACSITLEMSLEQ